MIEITKLLEYIIKHFLIKGWYGKITLDINDGVIVRMKEERIREKI